MTRVTSLSKEQLLASEMSEADLQDCVIAMAKSLGWRVHAERAAINQRGKWSTPIQGDEGYPDLTLTNETRLLFVELKSENGKLTPGQEEWIRLLRSSHVKSFVYVWRPSQWFSGEIERILRGKE